MAGIAGPCCTIASKLSCVAGAYLPAKSVSNAPLLMYFCKHPRGRLRLMTRMAVAPLDNGGYRPMSSGGSRRNSGNEQSSDSIYDPALDLDRIVSDSVRLLDENQNLVGIVSKRDAIRMADEAELILAVLSADPPVLRLFESEDYKKYKFEQRRRKKMQMKRSTANRADLKELKMGYNIDSHDYSVRLKAAQRFLKDGDKVKIIVSLKGRETNFRNMAIELIRRFQNDVGELAQEESKNFNEKSLYVILMPNKAAQQKAQQQAKKPASVAEVPASV
ncbi:hypothetical protein HPP92_017734 [Vanilla planifolia]|uniref:Translation initiation factor IF-3 n=1 Tax=Vanilla planifolia TaxID=51239 RepID=A0A835QCR9_VANPL|nr:hypothetical protein HPP92_017734 [Vanilla planifolia]